MSTIVLDSIARVAVALQVPQGKLLRAMTQLGMTPHLINGLAHADGEQQQRLKEHFAKDSK